MTFFKILPPNFDSAYSILLNRDRKQFIYFKKIGSKYLPFIYIQTIKPIMDFLLVLAPCITFYSHIFPTRPIPIVTREHKRDPALQYSLYSIAKGISPRDASNNFGVLRDWIFQ